MFLKVPDPVKDIKLSKSYNDSLYFSWTQPEGLIDSYLVTCSLVSLGVILSVKVESNTTTSSSCSNLLPSSSYEVYITSIRNIDNKMYSNGAKTYLSTRNNNKNLEMLHSLYFLYFDFKFHPMINFVTMKFVLNYKTY
jgi:hypothetical protein